MTTRRYETVDVTEGTGDVLCRGDYIARVDYTVRTRRELPGAEGQECQARQLIDGHVVVRKGEATQGHGALVLRMEDGREVTFLADLGNPDTGAFTIKISGSIRQAGC